MKIKDIVIREGLAATYKIVKTGPEGTVLQSPDMHTTLTLDPEASKGIVQNPDNPNQFTLSHAQATGTTDQTQPQGPKQGAEVAIPANEGMGGSYDMTWTIANPDFNAEDDDSPEEIDVGINYSMSGKYIPARINYSDYDHPAEYPELDELHVYNLETGEEITDRIDTSEIEQAVYDRADQQGYDDDGYDDRYDDRYDEVIGGEEDPTDKFISDVEDKEFTAANKPANEDLVNIRRLAGL